MDRVLESWSLSNRLRYLSDCSASFVFLLALNLLVFTVLPSWTDAADAPTALVYDQECLEEKERFSQELELLGTHREKRHAGDYLSDMVTDAIFNSDERCLKKNPWLLHPAKKEEEAVRELVDKQLQGALNASKHKP